MIVVDASALLAVILLEAERNKFLARLDGADHILISAATVVEARMVVYARAGPSHLEMLDELIRDYGFEIVPPGEAEIAAAHAAFITYGKGTGHPAQLNFGDLFSYALAKTRGVPLLFKGEDFSHTDIVSADP
jgi:ribonuclease VapC